MGLVDPSDEDLQLELRKQAYQIHSLMKSIGGERLKMQEEKDLLYH